MQTYSKQTIFRITAILLTGSFLAILNQTLLTTAIPHIMADLNLTESKAQWLTTIFMLVNGIMIPITAFLIETFTTRVLFLAAMITFATGTLIAGTAGDFPILIVGRVVQATGAGILMPLMMTIFLFIYPVSKRGAAMGMVGLVISFAPAIGPTLSGWLLEFYEWQGLFYIMMPLIIINIILAFFFMKNVTERTFPKVDIPSIILSSFGFGGLLFGFSSAGDFGWQAKIVIIPLVVGAVSLFLFSRRQFQLKQPILELRILKYKMFTLTTIIGMITFIGLIGSETILPIYMQNMAGFSALESGLMIMPGALIMGIMSPINGRIFDRYGGRILIIAGMATVLITTFFFTRLTAETSFTYLTIFFAIRMFGLSMIMMPASTTGLNQLPVHLLAHGTALSSTARQVAASIGTALLITVMTAARTTTGEIMDHELIQGVNTTFYLLTAITFVGLILTYFVYDPLKNPTERVRMKG